VSSKLLFVYKSTSLHSGEAHTLEASCMQEVTCQSIAEQQTDPKRRSFVTLHNSHIKVSNLRLTFDGTIADVNENSAMASFDVFGKHRSSSQRTVGFSLRGDLIIFNQCV